MFNDNQTITTTAGNTALGRRPNSNPFTGTFTSLDGSVILEIRQKSTRSRKRSEFVLTLRKIATDPLTAVTSEISASLGIYVDQPKVGFDANTEIWPYWNALRTFAGVNTNFDELLAGGA